MKYTRTIVKSDYYYFGFYNEMQSVCAQSKTKKGVKKKLKKGMRLLLNNFVNK